jgi:hypothetical protein
MNGVPLYRDFAVADALAHRPCGRPTSARRGFLRRIVDAIALSHQRAAERDIARFCSGRLGDPGGRLTDEFERRLFEHLADNHGLRP